MRFFIFCLLMLMATVVMPLNIGTIIQYNVIGLVNQTDSMAVNIDNTTYTLNRNDTIPLLHSGLAPAAETGYHYVRIINGSNMIDEPFWRPPTTNGTPYEFFNRTWNNYSIATFPQIYPELPAINRIQSRLHLEGQIPTLHIMGNQSRFDEMHNNSTEDSLFVKSNITYLSLNETRVFKKVEVSLAGRSSRWVPKLSYNLKLDDERLYGYRRLKLRAMATDPSYIREQLAYDIVKSVGLASSEFSFVRVFLNDRALGLFGLIETFQDPWLANTFANGSSKYKNGNLYQGVYATPLSIYNNHTSDLSYLGNNLTSYGEGQYKIKQEAAKSKDRGWRPLRDLTKFIATAPTNETDAVARWNARINTDSVLRAMALEVLLGYADGYAAMVDNYYMYQSPTNYIYIPSDMDLTFGSTMFNLSAMWSGNYRTYPGLVSRPLLKILDVPEFNRSFNQLLINTTNALVNPNATHARIDGLVDMIREDVAWDRSLSRVGENIFGSINTVGGGSNQTSGVLSAVIGDAFPSDLDVAAVQDLAGRINQSIPLETAVNGPTGHISLAGVKEWIRNVHQNVTRFYSRSNNTI
ncbi:MAG: coth protein-domain-containing protein [Benjaminiella poitrasii]|nr:MAG: coth protein-domain-containing protein [Benjaminiella poitrasii]